MNKSYILSGLIGSSILILILLSITTWLKPFNYQAVYIVNPKTVTNPSRTEALTCNQIAVLKDLENKGILLTPQEYTSQISDYYSTLVAFLIGLFVLFTIGSIYGISITSKKEIEESKQNIKEELKESLAGEIRDSKSFNESIADTVQKNMTGIILTKSSEEWMEITSSLKELNAKQTKLSEDIESIYEELGIDAKSEIKL
jgi:hypothetical protein